MRKQRGFTLVELLVVIAIIALLMSILMPALGRTRKQALAVACQARLHQWGLIFSVYTNKNDGYFHARQIGSDAGYLRIWNLVYEPYYHDREMLCCPAATNPERDLEPFGTWGGPAWDEEVASEFGQWVPINSDGNVDTTMFGSYGMNRNVPNLIGDAYAESPLWRRADARGAENAPVLLDCMYVNLWYQPEDQPPEYDGDIYQGDGISYACINRHLGHVNVCFMDFSARKVGLKQLWTLKGHRTFNTCGPWTICGFEGNVGECAEFWDDASPWMSDFPEY